MQNINSINSTGISTPVNNPVPGCESSTSSYITPSSTCVCPQGTSWNVISNFQLISSENTVKSIYGCIRN